MSALKTRKIALKTTLNSELKSRKLAYSEDIM